MNSISPPALRSRPSWTGLLRLSLVAVPVKAYAAVATRDAPHANMLHANCGQRIHYQKHCAMHGEVQTDAIVKGYPFGKEQYLIVEPEELDKLRPAKDQALQVEQFVSLSDIDPVRFAGRSLYLWPDGPAAMQPYAVLTHALARSGKAGLARIVLTGTRQVALVRPKENVLVLDLLHFPAQVKDMSSWQTELGPANPSAAELDLAGRLIDMASTPLDWSCYRDTNAEDLQALLQAKMAQQGPVLAAQEQPAVLSLLDALQRSLAVAVGADKEEPTARPKAKRRTA